MLNNNWLCMYITSNYQRYVHTACRPEFLYLVAILQSSISIKHANLSFFIACIITCKLGPRGGYFCLEVVSTNHQGPVWADPWRSLLVRTIIVHDGVESVCNGDDGRVSKLCSDGLLDEGSSVSRFTAAVASSNTRILVLRRRACLNQLTLTTLGEKN